MGQHHDPGQPAGGTHPPKGSPLRPRQPPVAEQLGTALAPWRLGPPLDGMRRPLSPVGDPSSAVPRGGWMPAFEAEDDDDEDDLRPLPQYGAAASRAAARANASLDHLHRRIDDLELLTTSARQAPTSSSLYTSPDSHAADAGDPFNLVAAKRRQDPSLPVQRGAGART